MVPLISSLSPFSRKDCHPCLDTGAHSDLDTINPPPQSTVTLQAVITRALTDDDSTDWSDETLRTLQREDDNIRLIVQWKQEGDRPGWCLVAPYNHVVKVYNGLNGILSPHKTASCFASGKATME